MPGIAFQSVNERQAISKTSGDPQQLERGGSPLWHWESRPGENPTEAQADCTIILFDRFSIFSFYFLQFYRILLWTIIILSQSSSRQPACPRAGRSSARPTSGVKQKYFWSSALIKYNKQVFRSSAQNITWVVDHKYWGLYHPALPNFLIVWMHINQNTLGKPLPPGTCPLSTGLTLIGIVIVTENEKMSHLSRHYLLESKGPEANLSIFLSDVPAIQPDQFF